MTQPRRHDRERSEERRGPDIARRGVLAASVSALAAGLAGCSQVTSQEFVADPVRLPEGVREELGLGEVFTDSQTTTFERTVGDQDIEVTITNQFAGYGRTASGPIVWSTPRPTLVDRFATTFRPDCSAGRWSPGINVVASEIGFEEFDPAFVDGNTPVDASEVTLVAPEWVRSGGELQHRQLWALHHADALGVAELTITGGNTYLVAAPEVIPSSGFVPTRGPDWSAADYEPDARWVAGQEESWVPADPGSMQCLVCLGERSPQDIFGLDEMPGRRLDDGETVGTENTILFMPAPKEDPAPELGTLDLETVFDAGYPTPMGGPSYALGVIATPNAEIAGESVNPLARTSGEQLLTSDVARGVLADAGLTHADEVEWLRGPEKNEMVTEWLLNDTVSVLGEEAGLTSYGGVVSCRNGPWAVAVHLAKATPNDVVIPLAMHRRPVGTPDGLPLFEADSGRGFIDRRWTTRALEFTTPVVGSLTAGQEEA